MRLDRISQQQDALDAVEDLPQKFMFIIVLVAVGKRGRRDHRSMQIESVNVPHLVRR